MVSACNRSQPAVPDALPRHMVAPWESYSDIVRDEMPPDVPADQAGELVTVLDDGRALLHRGTQPDLVLESDDVTLRLANILR